MLKKSSDPIADSGILSNLSVSGTAPVRKEDQIQRLIGAFGKYQLRLCLLLFYSKFFVAFHQIAIVFLAPKIVYTCPVTSDYDSDKLCPCAKPEYNKSVFTRTIITEWDLICERKWYVSVVQTLFQTGTLIGSVVFGMASDRFGRIRPFLFAVVMQILAGVIAAYVPNYWLFNFFRFVVGLSLGGTMIISFVIIMEFVGAKHRATISAIFQVPFNIGHMLLPVYGYFIRDYRHLQLCISAPAILMLSYFYFVPETPRWLIAVNRPDDAIKILEEVTKINKRPTDLVRSSVYEYQANLDKQQLNKGTILDLFRTPNLRKNILTMAYNWFTCSYCFYGVSQYMGQLTGNLFVNVTISASFTLLGTLMAIPLMKIMGRKTILIVFNFLTGLCLIVLTAIPEGMGSVACATVGQVASFIVFVVVYLYCSELFPTVVRNAAIGFSSMMARVGSMIAPFVVELNSSTAWAPPVVFAIVPLVAAVVSFLLPETKDCKLMTTIEEGEEFGRKQKSIQQQRKKFQSN